MRRYDFPPIGFKLGFTGTARADAAAELRHLHAAPGQTRQHVLQLRQFHLQLAFPRARVPRKNVEDQLRAVDHPPLDDFFDIALLRSSQIVIEEKQVGIHGRGRARNFLQLACADQSRGIGPVATLQNFTDNFRARASRQCAQFSQRFFRVKLWNARFVGAGLSRGMRWSSRLRHWQRVGRQQHRALPAPVQSPSAPLRPRVRTSSPTRKARSCASSAGTGCVPRGTRPDAGARSRVFLGCDLRKPKTPYPSLPEALAADAVAGADEDAVPVPAAAAFPSECATCAPCGSVRPITTVEMACLKINCSCPLASSTTEYLSKERMRPVNFTPLSR